jgi:hydroxymethylpyrimidine/phosphomethylpyrimidine kinase
VADLLAIGEMETIGTMETIGEKQWMEAPRIHSANTHGTGCTLSSAIAAYLALGASLPEAVQSARAYVREAVLAGASVRTGGASGHWNGPLNHGHSPESMRLWPLADDSDQ